MGLRQRLAALLGISAYQGPPTSSTASLEDAGTKQLRREINGGQLAPMPMTQTRFYVADVETAIQDADMGDISFAARLWTACRRDGVMSGVAATRTTGLVRLPKKFRGDPEQVAALEVGHDSVRSVFDEMFPPTELALLDADGIALGVGVGELCEVKGRDYPVFRRLDPSWLRYRRNEDRWYYQSVVGLIPITPGDGRWILHIPGGRCNPWQNGIWPAIGLSWINKTHAVLHRSNWEAKLANPARVATAPAGATEEQEQSWWRAVMAWGKNTVFGIKPGYDVKLLESNGIGYQSFEKTIATSEREMIIAWTGQSVSTDGGSGFINAELFSAIRLDFIQSDGEALAYTINTQGIPPWVAARWGIEALDRCALVAWDTKPPGDRAAEAAILTALGSGIKVLGEAVKPYNITLNVAEILQKAMVPVAGDTNGDGIPDEATEEIVLPTEEAAGPAEESAAA